MTQGRIRDYLDPNWQAEYDGFHSVIHQQLINLNLAIFYLERLEQFPLVLLFPLYEERTFWHFIRGVLIEHALLCADRVIVTTRGDQINIDSLRNQILNHLKDDEVKQVLEAQIEKVKFEARVKSLKAKVKAIRNNYIAHLNKQSHLNPTAPPVASISLQELQELLETTHELFNALDFSNHYSLWYWGYGEKKRDEEQTDFDLLLNAAASNSILMSYPEDQPESWKLDRADYSEQQITILNQIRQRLGKSPLP